MREFQLKHFNNEKRLTKNEFKKILKGVFGFNKSQFITTIKKDLQNYRNFIEKLALFSESVDNDNNFEGWFNDHDILHDEFEKNKKRRKMEECLEKHQNKNPKNESLIELELDSEIALNEELEYYEIVLSYYYPCSFENPRMIGKYLWIHFPLPPYFPYSCVALMNHPRKGLLHTLIGHLQDWYNYIPELKIFEKYLKPFQPNLNEIKKFTEDKDRKKKKEKIDLLIEIVNEKYSVVKFALFRMEIILRQFLVENLTNDQYIGCDMEGDYFRIYFVLEKIKDTPVMVLGVSDELYPAVLEFDQMRPLCLIITIYFISFADMLAKEPCVSRNGFTKKINKDEILENHRNSLPCGNLLSSTHPKMYKKGKILNLMKYVEKYKDDLSKMSEIFNQKIWFHLEMPLTFDHAGAILWNDSHGLLYILLLKFNTLLEYFTYFDIVKEKLLPIKDLMDVIQNSKIDTKSRDPINNLLEFIQNLDDSERLDVYYGLMKGQFEVYKIMEFYITEKNYKGDGVYPNGVVYTCFEIKIKGDKNVLMIMNLSRDVYLDGGLKHIRKIFSASFTLETYYNFEYKAGRAFKYNHEKHSNLVRQKTKKLSLRSLGAVSPAFPVLFPFLLFPLFPFRLSHKSSSFTSSSHTRFNEIIENQEIQECQSL